MPSRVRTYAPRGQTPILRAPLAYEHLSVISAITPQGRLLMQVQERGYRATDVVHFLRHLLRHVAGPLMVVWDGASIQRAQAIKDFLATAAGRRLHLVRLPAYAPDLNPVEGLWRYLKQVELRNLSCPSLAALRRHLRLATVRLRRKPHLIQSCIRQVGIYL